MKCCFLSLRSDSFNDITLSSLVFVNVVIAVDRSVILVLRFSFMPGVRACNSMCFKIVSRCESIVLRVVFNVLHIVSLLASILASVFTI